MSKNHSLHLGDSEKLLQQYPDNYFSGCITDCNYGISFMNLKWDYDLPPVGIWREVFRTLAPGGKLLCFGSPRMFHRLACDLESANFELQNCICWLYGQGMPHGINIAKAITKNERGHPYGGSDPSSPNHGKYKGGSGMGNGPGRYMKENGSSDNREYSEESLSFYDYHSHLKPAWEPILVFSKPFNKGDGYVENILKYGVAGFNIGATRIETDDNLCGGAYGGGVRPTSMARNTGNTGGGTSSMFEGGTERLSLDQYRQPTGRFTSNIVLSHSPQCEFKGYKKTESITGDGDTKTPGHHYEGNLGYFDRDGNEIIEDWQCDEDCPVRSLNGQTSDLKGGKYVGHNRNPKEIANRIYGAYNKDPQDVSYGDAGGASRFFYCSKSSRCERDKGCEHLYWKRLDRTYLPVDKNEWEQLPEGGRSFGNIHQTVKPISLLSYLVKLLIMPNNRTIILDPFMGSGTTGIACLLNSVKFVGMDIEESSAIIAEARLNYFDQ